MQYLSGRKAAHLLLGVLLAGIAVTLLAEFTGNTKLMATLLGYLIEWPGPLAVFGLAPTTCALNLDRSDFPS